MPGTPPEKRLGFLVGNVGKGIGASRPHVSENSTETEGAEAVTWSSGVVTAVPLPQKDTMLFEIVFGAGEVAPIEINGIRYSWAEFR
jgi:hypothetical protein